MLANQHRSRFAAAAFCAFAAFFAAPPVSAQSAPPADQPRLAVVKMNDVYVRCGASESHYPFARLRAGDLVQVTGEKFEWSRVVTAGPAFGATFGYIKHAKGDTSRFRVATDGKTGQTLGKVDVIAPNLDTRNNPRDSWKALVRLEADQTLRVIETMESGSDVVHKVVLPETAVGWISTAHLETATTAQAAQWDRMLQDHRRAVAEGAKPAPAATGLSRSSAASAKPTATSPAPPSPADSDEPLADLGEVTEPVTTVSSSPAATETAPMTAAAPAKPEPRLPTWDDLEVALKQLQREPIETAEVTPLRDLYLDLARRNTSDARLVRMAHGRADQLKIWADLQAKRAELDAIRARARMSAEETIAFQKALEASAQYDAVGRVAASTIYDGKNLPKLLRLQDAATGRTLAYLQPDEDFELVKLIGNLVGVVGEKNYDGAMRLNIIEPKRIDILMPDQPQHATVPIDTPRPE